MDKNKQPGIKFVRVYLSRLNYVLPQVEPKNFEYDLNLSDTFKINKNKLIHTLTIQLYEGFSFELTGIFETIKDEENLDLERFAGVNANALMLPFAREIISNITSRTPLPHLLLPPINLVALKKKVAIKEKKLFSNKKKSLKK